MGYTGDNDSILLDTCRVTEAAALAASRWIGRGDEKKADAAAVQAMRTYLNNLPISGTVVIGEGERDEAPMLYIGEKVGAGGRTTQIALDPLEGTTICATGNPNSLAVLSMTENGKFLYAADVYMDKIAVGIDMPSGAIDLDFGATKNIQNYADITGKKIDDITVCILDRPRHQSLIGEVRKLGAKIHLIGDGDVHAVIATTLSTSPVDIYMGSGGAPEGVLAASALRCVGGFMQGRLILDSKEKIERAKKMGIDDIDKKYLAHDLAKGDVIFAATGVTDGHFLKGVHIDYDKNRTPLHATTNSIVMRSKTGTVRKIETCHNLTRKSWLQW